MNLKLYLKFFFTILMILGVLNQHGLQACHIYGANNLTFTQNPPNSGLYDLTFQYFAAPGESCYMYWEMHLVEESCPASPCTDWVVPTGCINATTGNGFPNNGTQDVLAATGISLCPGKGYEAVFIMRRSNTATCAPGDDRQDAIINGPGVFGTPFEPAGSVSGAYNWVGNGDINWAWFATTVAADPDALIWDLTATIDFDEDCNTPATYTYDEDNESVGSPTDADVAPTAEVRCGTGFRLNWVSDNECPAAGNPGNTYQIITNTTGGLLNFDASSSSNVANECEIDGNTEPFNDGRFETDTFQDDGFACGDGTINLLFDNALCNTYAPDVTVTVQQDITVTYPTSDFADPVRVNCSDACGQDLIIAGDEWNTAGLDQGGTTSQASMLGDFAGGNGFTGAWSGQICAVVPGGNCNGSQDAVTIDECIACGVYDVAYAITNTNCAGCSTTTTKQIEVVSPRVVNASADILQVCGDYNFTLAADVVECNPATGAAAAAPYTGAGTLIWARDDGGADDDFLVVEPAVAGSCLTVNFTPRWEFAGCAACNNVGAPIAVQVCAAPAVPTATDEVSCPGEIASPLTAVSDATTTPTTPATFNWYDANPTTGAASIFTGNPFVSPETVPGVYTYWVTETDANGCISLASTVSLTILPEIMVEIIKTPVCDGDPDANGCVTDDVDAYNFEVVVTLGAAFPGETLNVNFFDVAGTTDQIDGSTVGSGALTGIDDFVVPNTSPAVASVTTTGDIVYTFGYFGAPADGAYAFDVVASITVGAVTCEERVTQQPCDECSCLYQFCDVEDTALIAGPTGLNTGLDYQFVLTNNVGVIQQLGTTVGADGQFDISTIPVNAQGGLCQVFVVSYDGTDATTAAYVAASLTVGADIATFQYQTDACLCTDVSFGSCYIEKLPNPEPPTVTPDCVCLSPAGTFDAPGNGGLTATCNACPNDACGVALTGSDIRWYYEDPANVGTFIEVIGAENVSPFNPADATYGIQEVLVPGPNTFYASCTCTGTGQAAGQGCESDFSPVNFQVIPAPDAPDVADPEPFCQDEPIPAITVASSDNINGSTFEVFDNTNASIAGPTVVAAGGTFTFTPTLTQLGGGTEPAPGTYTFSITEEVTFTVDGLPGQCICTSIAGIFEYTVLEDPDATISEACATACTDGGPLQLGSIFGLPPLNATDEVAWFATDQTYDGNGNPNNGQLENGTFDPTLYAPDTYYFFFSVTTVDGCNSVSNLALPVTVVQGTNAQWDNPGPRCGGDLLDFNAYIIEAVPVGATEIWIEYEPGIVPNTVVDEAAGALTSTNGTEIYNSNTAVVTPFDPYQLPNPGNGECEFYTYERILISAATDISGEGYGDIEPDGIADGASGSGLTCDQTCTTSWTNTFEICPREEADWNGGFICCDAGLFLLPGGAAETIADATALDPNAAVITQTLGDGSIVGATSPIYNTSGTWSGDGVFYVDIDGDFTTNDGYYYYDPTVDPSNALPPTIAGGQGSFIGAEGEITVHYEVGSQPCQTTYTQDFYVYCEVDATINDFIACKCGCGQFDLTALFEDGVTTQGGLFTIDDSPNATINDGTGSPDISPANGSIIISGDIITYDPASITESTTIDISYAIGNPGLQGTACVDTAYATLTIQPTPSNIEFDLPDFWCDNGDLDLDIYTVESVDDNVTACQYIITAPDGTVFSINDDPNTATNIFNNDLLINIIGIPAADIYGLYTIEYTCEIDNGDDPNCISSNTEFILWNDYRASDWLDPSPVCAGDAAFILNDLIDLGTDTDGDGVFDVEANPADDADTAWGELGGVFSGPFVTNLGDTNGDGFDEFEFDPTDDITNFGYYTVTYCNGDGECQECTSIDIAVYPAVDASLTDPVDAYCQADGDIDLETLWITGVTTAGGAFTATYTDITSGLEVPAVVIGNEYLDVSSLDFTADPDGCIDVTVSYVVGTDLDYFPQVIPTVPDFINSACFDSIAVTFQISADVVAEFSLDPSVICADAIGEVFTVLGDPTIGGTFTITSTGPETLDADNYNGGLLDGTLVISANGTLNDIDVQYCVGGNCTDDVDQSCQECYTFTIQILETIVIEEGIARNFCLSDSNIDFSTFFSSPETDIPPVDEGDDDDGEYFLNGEQFFGSDLVIADSLVGNHTITYCVGTYVFDGTGTIVFDVDGLTVLGFDLDETTDSDGDGDPANDIDQDLDNCTNCASVSFDICRDTDASWNTPAFLCEDGYFPEAADQDDADAGSGLYELISTAVANGEIAGTDYSYYTWSVEDSLNGATPLYEDAAGTILYTGGQLTGNSIWFDPIGLSDQSEIEVCLTVHAAGTLEDAAGVDLCASCSQTFCYEIPIVSDYEAGLFDGYNQTWCIEDFRDEFPIMDLTQLLDATTPGNGYFTVTYEDGSTAGPCYPAGGSGPNPPFADPSITGCLDGFIWNTDSLTTGDYTIRYTVEGSGECARYDEIVITLIEAMQDCFDPPTLICEAQGSYNAAGAYNLTDWVVCGDGCEGSFTQLSYYNNGAQDILPVDTVNSGNCYNYGFINPGTQNVTISPSAIPPGSTILSVEVSWSYEAAACIAEGDLDTATVAFPDGTVIAAYGNDAGPNNDDDFYAWQTQTYGYDEINSPAMASALNSLLTCTPQAFTYDLQSNAANFTIGMEVSITWSSCIFEAVLHETNDEDGIDINTINLPYDQNMDGDYDDPLDIPGGVYTEVIGNEIFYYFDANGLNAIDAVVDITYSQASCGACSNAETQSILVVDDYLAAFVTDTVILCNDASQIDLTQFLAPNSDNGGNFSSSDLTVNGDIVDITGLEGTFTIYYDVADGVNTCGAAVDTLVLNLQSTGDPSGITFNSYYCEGDDITMPFATNGAIGIWTYQDVDNNTVTLNSGDVLNTAGLSVLNPITATFTVGTGDCARSEDYLIVIESAYDAVLATDVAACESAIGNALIMNSNGCINMDQFVLPNPSFGAGFWTQTSGAGSLSGTIFCPDGADTYTFEFTVPGSGSCGAVRTFSITINPDADASFTFPTIICSGDDALNMADYVAGLTQTFTGQVCISGNNVEVVNPSYTAPDYAYLQLPAIPVGAIISEVSLDYNYVAGPGNPNADGDLDLYNITMPDGSTIVTWLNNSGPNGNDNHFDFGSDLLEYNDVDNNFNFDTNSFINCNPGAIELEVVSNSAFWDACIDVSITYTTGDFSVIVTETGDDVADLGVPGGISYDGLGTYSLDPTGLCDINEFTIEFNRFDCFCPATGSNVFQVVCGGDASLTEDVTICFEESIDLTQFFTDTTNDNGEFSGEGVLGPNLVPDAAGGTYTVTYTQGIEGSVCGSSDEIIITVEPSIDASIQVPLTLCGLDDESWDLAAYSTNAGGTWTVTNSGATAGGPSFTGSVLSSNGYTGLVEITYSITSGDCTASDSETIEIVHTVQADLENVTICYDDDVDLTQLFAEGTTYGGMFIGVNDIGVAAPIAGYTLYPPTTGGTYTITYDVGDAEWNCGMEIGTATLTVAASIDAEWDGPSSFCADQEFYVLSNYFTTTTQAGGSWAITSGGGLLADGAYYPDGYTGFVIISYTVNNGDCSETHEEVIQILGDLDATFDLPATACIGDVIDLCAMAVTAGGQWSGMGVENCTFTASMAGVFVVTYEVGDDACDNVYSKAITVYEVPSAPIVVGADGICSSEEDRYTITISGEFFDHYVVYFEGAIVAEGVPFYGNTLEFDPLSVLGDEWAGSATFTIVSANQGGCESEGVEVTYVVYPAPVYTYEIGCTDANSNLAALTVEGLIEPYQIAVYPQGTTPTVADYNPVNDPLAIIEAGVPYNIMVMDDNGCPGITEGVIAELALEYEAAISCTDENGEVTVTITVDENTGYGSPYEYSYNGGISYTSESFKTLSALANPTISILVRDQKGCLSSFETFTIGDGGALAPTASCNDNGTVTIDLGYSGSNFTASYDYNGENVILGGSSSTFTLNVEAAGTVNISVTDLSGSVACDLSGEIMVYPELTVDVNPDLDGCPQGSVATSVTATGGNAPFSLMVDGEDAGSFSAVSIQELGSGDHTIMITDASGCTATTMVNIPESVDLPAPALVYNTSLSSATSVCGGGELTLEVTGGSTYVWTIDGETQTETGNTLTTSYSASALVTVSTTDASGCVGEALEIPITYYPPLANSQPIVVCNGNGTYTVNFDISGGNVAEPYFVDASGVVFENFGTVSATYNLDVPYSFTITSPESGCALIVSGSDECEDPNFGEGCDPILTQGNLNCETGEVTITVSDAGSDFDVIGITGGAATDVNVATDGFGTIVVSFTLNASNTGAYIMTYNPGGNGCVGTIDFPISVDCSNVTAINLLRFEGEVLETGNNLMWTTGGEVDADYFTVERSIDGMNFEAIGNVNATGNNSNIASYSLLDTDAPSGKSFYRLLETDNNGSTAIVSDVVKLSRADEFDVIDVYPIPTTDWLNIDLTVWVDARLITNVYDVTGKLVKSLNYDVTGGTSTITIDASDFTAGTYFVTINNGTSVENVKFIKK